jgi:hypothetical protein
MLARQSPSAITTRIVWVSCGGQMPLELVDPAWNSERMDNHVFRCIRCGQTETYSFARG